MGSLATNPVTLEWLGNNLDSDIAPYNIYLYTNNPPTQLQKENTTNTSEENIFLIVDTIYYWMIETKDDADNT